MNEYPIDEKQSGQVISEWRGTPQFPLHGRAVGVRILIYAVAKETRSSCMSIRGSPAALRRVVVATEVGEQKIK